MDFNAILRGALPQMAANISSLGENMSKKGLPDGMAQLLPLLGSRFNPLLQPLLLVQHLMGGWLGLDPTVLLTFFGFCWAANKVWRQVSTTVGGLVHRYLSSSIRVSSGDEIYLHLMKWLADLPKMANSRSLMAETVGKTAWEDEDESDVLKTRISADGSGVYLNFSNQESKAVSRAHSAPPGKQVAHCPLQPPRFIPAMGLHSFWHKGTYFRLHRKQESLLEDGAPGSGVQTMKDREYLVISCYGWSPSEFFPPRRPQVLPTAQLTGRRQPLSRSSCNTSRSCTMPATTPAPRCGAPARRTCADTAGGTTGSRWRIGRFGR